MNVFTKSALTFLLTAGVATVALAQPGDGTYGNVTSGQAKVNALETQLANKNVAAETSVDTNAAAISPAAKAATLNEEAQDLELQLKALKTQRSE
ncbi:MAG: hypothetical protein ACTIM4_14870 [Marinomonas sp.]